MVFTREVSERQVISILTVAPAVDSSLWPETKKKKTFIIKEMQQEIMNSP